MLPGLGPVATIATIAMLLPATFGLPPISALIMLWVKMIMVPYHRLYPAMLMFCAIGVFSLNNSEFDVWLMTLLACLALSAPSWNWKRRQCCSASSSAR